MQLMMMISLSWAVSLIASNRSITGWTIDRAQRIIDTYIAMSSALAAAVIEPLEAHRAKKERNEVHS
jgi:hypothetical protein